LVREEGSLKELSIQLIKKDIESLLENISGYQQLIDENMKESTEEEKLVQLLKYQLNLVNEFEQLVAETITDKLIEIKDVEFVINQSIKKKFV
jgi:hypothetical protein